MEKERCGGKIYRRLLHFQESDDSEGGASGRSTNEHGRDGSVCISSDTTGRSAVETSNKGCNKRRSSERKGKWSDNAARWFARRNDHDNNQIEKHARKVSLSKSEEKKDQAGDDGGPDETLLDVVDEEVRRERAETSNKVRHANGESGDIEPRVRGFLCKNPQTKSTVQRARVSGPARVRETQRLD